MGKAARGVAVPAREGAVGGHIEWPIYQDNYQYLGNASLFHRGTNCCPQLQKLHLIAACAITRPPHMRLNFGPWSILPILPSARARAIAAMAMRVAGVSFIFYRPLPLGEDAGNGAGRFDRIVLCFMRFILKSGPLLLAVIVGLRGEISLFQFCLGSSAAASGAG